VLAQHTARTLEALDRTLHEARDHPARQDARRYATDADARVALRHLAQTSPAIIALGWDRCGRQPAVPYLRGKRAAPEHRGS
jgi:hypothetical protein